MRNKRTATITWVKHYNFGTILQAYALQQYILYLGYENHILNDTYIIEPDQKKSNIFFIRVIQWVKLLLNPSFKLYYKNKVKSKKLFIRFITDYLLIDYDTDWRLFDDKYDQYIVGSDQIWNPGPIWYKELNTPFYYAGFTNKKKISYASSLGVSVYPDKHLKQFREYLSDYKYLSAREDIGCKIIADITEKEVTHVVDPTLLLPSDNWRKLIGEKPTSHEKYVLAYFLSDNKYYLDYVRQYASKYHLSLKMFHNFKKYSCYADELVVAGPLEFLQYIDGASILFTDSFHGTLFAIQLDTPFVAFKRFNGQNEGQNQRLISLLNTLDISDRFIREDNCEKIEDLLPLNFESIKQKLSMNIELSRIFLQKALES